MSSTYVIYKNLVGTYGRLGRDTAPLALKLDLAFALGRLSDEEYTELVLEAARKSGEDSAE